MTSTHLWQANRAFVSVPFVSCLMPTFNRRPFVARTIAYYQRQTYTNRELIILDDGDDPIADLVPADPAIRYLRAPRFGSLGAKRNAACEAAKGDILLHWDDDDWYAPHRVKTQVEALCASGADLCGIDRVWFLDPAAPAGWEYVYPQSGPPWVCGATLCFQRDYWRAHPFSARNIGEDTIFAAGADRAHLHILPDKDIFVGLIHKANTCARRTQDAFWRPAPLEEIRSAMGADWRNYVVDESSHLAAAADKNVSVIIPHGGEHRLPHLAACLAHLAQARAVGEIIVVELGERPVAHEIAERWGAKHIFARDDGLFSRARALNIGAALATGHYVLWLDNDLLVPSDFVVAATKEMQRGDLDFLIPYSIIHYLSESDSEKVREGAVDPNRCRPILSLAPGQMVSGGAGLLRRDFFRRHGGIPEGFRGWGGEDNAWAHKANLLGRSGVGADSAQKLWHLYHPTSGAHDPHVHHKNPHYAENLRLLERLCAIKDKQLYVEMFPPQPPSCAWDRDKTIIFVASGGRAAAGLAADGMKKLLGLDIRVVQDDADLAMRLEKLAPDAIVLFGAEDDFPARAGVQNFAERTIIFSNNEMQGDSLALASVLAQPLSRLLNGAGAPKQIPALDDSQDLAVWTYWEGECPEWIVSCRASIAAHAPRIRHLDRTAFELLRENDRDIDIDRLEIAHRADFIRAYLLAHHGGLWIDSDCIAIKSLAPLLDLLRDNDFLAHRDRQNFYPNGFIGARRGSVIAMEFYRRLCAILRSGATLGWISLGGEPLTQLLTSAKTPFREIPCEWIQPVCWSLPETFFVVADATTHERAINSDAFCYMLSNTEIRKHQAARPELELMAPGSFFRFLIDRSAQNAKSPPAQEKEGLARARAEAKLFAEAMSFFLGCYADRAPARVIEVAHRLGLWGALIGNLAGVELHGVACSPAGESEKSFNAIYAGVTEAEAEAPLDKFSGHWELLILSDPLRDWPDALRASLIGRALELSKSVMVWNCGPSHAGMDKYFSSHRHLKVEKRRVARADNLVMEALLLSQEEPAAETIDPATRDIFERLYRSNVAAGGESVSGPGSSLGQTGFLRRSLPLLLQNLGVRSLIDAPCGDFNWMRHVELGIVSYLGVDIVDAVVEGNQNAFANARRQFQHADITRQILPCADLILSRDCLVHLSFEDIRLVLRNFWRSGATYLLMTNFAPHRANQEIATGDWRPLNFQADPFNFPPPLRRLLEGCTEMNSIYADKSLSLWRLRDIEQLMG